MGGNRTGNVYFHLITIFFLTGLWHGAAWNYVGWGAYYGLLLICEKFIWGKALSKAPAIVGHIYTIAIFIFGWSFFWITDSNALVEFWKAMIGGYGLTGSSTFWQLTAWEYWPVLIACVLASTPIVPLLKERLIAWCEERPVRPLRTDGGAADPRNQSASWLCTLDCTPTKPSRAAVFQVVAVVLDLMLLGLLLLSCASVVSGSFNPFIYFQF